MIKLIQIITNDKYRYLNYKSQDIIYEFYSMLCNTLYLNFSKIERRLDFILR